MTTSEQSIQAVAALRDAMHLDGPYVAPEFPAEVHIAAAAFGFDVTSSEFLADIKHRSKFLPTLVSGIQELLKELQRERKLRERNPKLAWRRQPIDPLEWLAQWLYRNNPYQRPDPVEDDHEGVDGGPGTHHPPALDQAEEDYPHPAAEQEYDDGAGDDGYDQGEEDPVDGRYGHPDTADYEQPEGEEYEGADDYGAQEGEVDDAAVDDEPTE